MGFSKTIRNQEKKTREAATKFLSFQLIKNNKTLSLLRISSAYPETFMEANQCRNIK